MRCPACHQIMPRAEELRCDGSEHATTCGLAVEHSRVLACAVQPAVDDRLIDVTVPGRTGASLCPCGAVSALVLTQGSDIQTGLSDYLAENQH